MTESRKMRRAGNMARVEEKRNLFMVLVLKPDRQVTFGSPTHK